MAALRRVTAGAYRIEKAVPLQTLIDSADPAQHLLPVDSMFTAYPAVTLTDNQEKRCRNGGSFTCSLEDGTYRVYSKNGEFLALSKATNGEFSTIKSFFAVE